jgi:hypothetical protein
MGTKRICPVGGKYSDGLRFGDKHSFSLLNNHRIQLVAGHSPSHLYDQAILTPPDGKPFIRRVDNVHIEKNFPRLLPRSFHRAKVNI